MRDLPYKKRGEPMRDARATHESISLNADDDFLRSELRRAGLFLPENDMPVTGWLFVNSDGSVGTRPLTVARDYVRFYDKDRFLAAAKRVICKNG